MKKTIILFCLFVFSFPVTFAQLNDETNEDIVNDILTLYFQTIGQDKLLKTNTYMIKGKVLNGESEMPFTSYNKRPLFYRIETEIRGMKIIGAFDGDSGWTINPVLGSSAPQRMTADEIERSKFRADYDGMFYNYVQKGYFVEFIDKDYVGFAEAYVLKLTSRDEDEITAYIDTENNVMLKLSSYILTGDTTAELEFYFRNHRFVDDMLFPFEIETKVNGKTEMKMIVENITIDADMPDTMFQMPGYSDSNDQDQ